MPVRFRQFLTSLELVLAGDDTAGRAPHGRKPFRAFNPGR
jgi:hypothetical protein